MANTSNSSGKFHPIKPIDARSLLEYSPELTEEDQYKEPETNQKYHSLYEGTEQSQEEKDAQQNDRIGKWGIALKDIGHTLANENPSQNHTEIHNRIKNELNDAALGSISSGIDDGNTNDENRKSGFISGEELRRQVESGLPGPDPDTIEDKRIYPKHVLAERYDYPLYEENESDVAKQGLDRLAADTVINVDKLGRLRTKATDFLSDKSKEHGWDNLSKLGTVDVQDSDGNNTNIKQSDFADNILPQYIKLVNGEFDKSDLDKADEDDLFFKNGYSFNTPDGEMKGTDFNIISYPKASYDPSIYDVAPEVVEITDENGEKHQYSFNNKDEASKLTYSESEIPSDKENADFYRPNFTTENGDNLSLDQVNNIITSNGNDSDTAQYHNGKFNMAKNRIFLNEPYDSDKPKGERFDFSDTLPMITDAFGYSAPILSLQTGIPYGLAGAHLAENNINPNDYDPATGSFSYNTDPTNPNVGEWGSNIAANAALPITESMLGTVGPSLIKPLKAGGKIASAIKNKALLPPLRLGLDIAGEAPEEILGNINEEYMKQSPQSWYGNQVYRMNDDGTVARNLYGQPIAEANPYTNKAVQDPNTSASDRLANFWNDAPNAALLGAGMGAIGAVPRLPSTVRQSLDAYTLYDGNNRDWNYKADEPRSEEDQVEELPYNPWVDILR